LATDGTFILADIGGYTPFLSGVSLEHAKKVTSNLFNSMLKANHGHWRVGNVEGDCIFFYREGREQPEALLAHARNLYEDFCGQIIDLSGGGACPCGVCTKINQLALKVVVHAGEFDVQRIGSRRELIGADVVTAHRLLKNSVPVEEYILFTTKSLEGLPALTEIAANGKDEYEEIGRVSYSYLDLEPVRRAIEAGNRLFLTPDQARVNLTTDIDAPPDVVWDTVTNKRMEWQGMKQLVELPGRRGRLGQVHRCTWPMGASIAEVTTAIDETSRRVTVKVFVASLFMSSLMKDAYATVEVNERPGGRSRVGFYMTFKEAIPIVSHVACRIYQLLTDRFQGRALRRLRAFCERAAQPPSKSN